MKSRRIILWQLIIASIFFVGCVNKDFDPKTWDVNPELLLSKPGLVFSSEPGSDTISIITNYNEYSVDIINNTDESNLDWCTVEKDKENDKIIITVQANKSISQRQVTLRIRIGHGTYFDREIFIIQMGGQWDVMGPFTLFLNYDLTLNQKEILNELLSSMIYVKGGTFYMGCQNQDEYGLNYCSFWNYNLHKVTLDDYYICPYEITQKQYLAFVGNNPSIFQDAQKPVENISWNEALYFCERLSKLTSLNISLPTEAQWEYAARGGGKTHYYLFPGSNSYEEVAVCSKSLTGNSTAKVGSLMPNELSLYDMAGNVAEYCMDYYDSYSSGEAYNPVGPSIGSSHVIRGGNFNSNMEYFCSYGRDYTPYNYSNDTEQISKYTGIRITIRP